MVPMGEGRASGLMERWVMVKRLWSLSAKCCPRKRENADVEEQWGRRFALGTKEASMSTGTTSAGNVSLAKRIPASRRSRRVFVG